jgi:hypothetical protein
MDLSVGIANALNPAMRKALGLGDDDKGVMVSSVQSAGVSAGKLMVGDVLLAIDGLDIASDGMVNLDGERVLMSEVAERKFRGDSVKIKLLRAKLPREVTITFDYAWPHLMQANAYDLQPAYVLYGGLLFQPLTRNLLGTYQFSNERINYYYDNFVIKELYKDHPEIIVLSAILPDPINTYLSEFREGIVEEINERKIRTLKDVAEAFAEKPEFYVIKFIGYARPLVLDRAAVEAARERINQRYNVLKEQNLTTSEFNPL